MSKKPTNEKNVGSSSKKESQKSTKKSPPIEPVSPKDLPIDLNDKNWEAYSGPIFYNKEYNFWYCKECEEIIDHSRSVEAHARKVHRLYEKDDNNQDEKNVGSSISKDSTYYQNIADRGKSDIDNGEADEELIALVYNLDKQKMSRAAAEVASDPYVLFIFTEMKKKKYISPYMSFGDYVRYCIQLHVDFMKIEYKFAINETALARNPDRAQMLANIAKEWEDYEREHGKVIQTID